MVVRGEHMAAVDGGGTGTRLRLHAPGGDVLAETRAGPSSLTLGIDRAWESVGAALREATARAGLGAPETLALRIVAGFAGGRTRANRDAFRAADPFGCRDITIVTDGYASLMGALGGVPGVVLAVGTGVTAYSLAPEGAVRDASGWGFPVGDEGGGAWLGMRAVQAYLKRLDGRLVADAPVFDDLALAVGEGFDAIQRWLRAARSTEMAALAPAVVRAADAGDAIAAAILAEGTRELEQAIAAVDPGGGVPVAILGGLAEVYAPRLDAGIRARLVPARGSALDGLRLVAGQGASAEEIE